jgi:hypothetical protein
VVAELAELRTQVGRIETLGRESEAAGQPAHESPEPSTSESAIAEEINQTGVGAESGSGGVTADQANTESLPPSDTLLGVDTPSAIITEFASRTPRRMGRTLFADEG